MSKEFTWVKRTQVMLKLKEHIDWLLEKDMLEQAGAIEFTATILRELPPEIIGFTDEGGCVFTGDTK